MRTRWASRSVVPAILAVLAVGLSSSRSKAEPGSVLPVQGVVRDNTGAPVAEGRFAMRFRLYPSASGGEPVWEEHHPAPGADCAGDPDLEGCVEVRDGTFTARLGSQGQPLDATLFSKNEALWLGISVEGEPELPRRPLDAVGRAMLAQRASVADDVDCSGCVGSGDVSFDAALWSASGGDVYRAGGAVGIGTDSPASALEVDGTVTADAFDGGSVQADELEVAGDLTVEGDLRFGGGTCIDGGAFRPGGQLSTQERNDYEVSFNRDFSATPVVVVTPVCQTSGDGCGGFDEDGMQIVTGDTDANGFQVFWLDRSESSSIYALNWIAYGPCAP